MVSFPDVRLTKTLSVQISENRTGNVVQDQRLAANTFVPERVCVGKLYDGTL